jgi:signal peptidase I
MEIWTKLLMWGLGCLGGALLILYYTVLDVWTVPSDDPLLAASVAPTLQQGDVLIVTRHGSVDRGNLLRCGDPQAPGRYVVGRAMGRWGDDVDITGELVRVDGRRNPSPHACDTAKWTIFDPIHNSDVVLSCSVEEYGGSDYLALREGDYPEPSTKANIEQGQWYLVSDDRHIHLDSRDFGSVDPSTCQHILFRLVGPAGVGDSKSRLTVLW